MKLRLSDVELINSVWIIFLIKDNGAYTFYFQLLLSEGFLIQRWIMGVKYSIDAVRTETFELKCSFKHQNVFSVVNPPSVGPRDVWNRNMFIKNVWLWTLLSVWGSSRNNDSGFQRSHWLADQLLAGFKISLLQSRLATQHRLPWWSTPVTSVTAWWRMMMMVMVKPKGRRLTHSLASCYSHDFIFLLSLTNRHFFC